MKEVKYMSSEQAPKVQIVEIGPEHEGQRVDNYLVTFLKGVPKSYIYRILRKGEVRVNKGRVKPVYRLQSGDLLRIPPVRVSDAKSAPLHSERVLDELKNSIIYEDNEVIVLNKPSGIAVHGGSGVNYGVIEAMRVIFPMLKRLELVHRLDKDTSGCLLLAKKASALKMLHEAMREGRTQKFYFALLGGRIGPEKRVIKAPLRKFVAQSGERFVKVDEIDGKPSHTVLTVEKRFSAATQVGLELLTGRTHQIRVHCAHIGHPIIGDDKYGDEELDKKLRKRGIKRLCLHARKLIFPLPATGEMKECVAPLDRHLSSAIEILEKE